MSADADEDQIDHTSSARCRSLLDQGFEVAKLADYNTGTLVSVLNVLQTVYASFMVINPFSSDEGDHENKYYIDQPSGVQKMVTTVYYKLTEEAKNATPRWTLLNVDFKNTAHPSAKMTHDHLAGKQGMYWSNLLINPYAPRNRKLRETYNIIRQVKEQMDWDINADHNILTGNYNQKGGWQWSIAAEYFSKYAKTMDSLFHSKKVTDLSGHTLKAYGEAEMSKMVRDIEKREQKDNSRKRVAYISFQTEPTTVELETLQSNALKATENAQKSVFAYTGSKEFPKPKVLKNPLKPSAEIRCKAITGKHGTYWRCSIWILFQDERMAKVPASVMCWSLAGHPTIKPQEAGVAASANKKQSNTFAAQAQAAWNTYSTPTQAKKAKKPKTKSGKKDFGGAGADLSSSSASSTSGQTAKSTSRKNRKDASQSNLQAFQQGSATAMQHADDLASRLQKMESQLSNVMSRSDVAKMAKAEVTKRFKRFEDIMRDFALAMTSIKNDLQSSATTAKEIAEALADAPTLTTDERKALEAKYSFPGMTPELLQQVVNQALQEQALKDLSISKKVSTIGADVAASAKRLGTVYRNVSNTVDRLAREAGAEAVSPAVLGPSKGKGRKRIRDVGESEEDKGTYKKIGLDDSSSDSESAEVGTAGEEATAFLAATFTPVAAPASASSLMASGSGASGSGASDSAAREL